MTKDLLNTVFLIGLQNIIVVLQWIRMSNAKEHMLQYFLILLAASSVLSLLYAIPRGPFKWSSVKRVLQVQHFAFDKFQTRSLKRQIEVEQRRNTELKFEFDKLRVSYSLLKADAEELRNKKQSLMRNHLRARSLTNSLALQVCSLSKALEEERADLSRHNKRLRLTFGLVLGFFQYALLAVNRIRLLSAGTSIQQHRFSILLSAHLALRARYLNLMDLSVEARQMVKKLKHDLHDETNARWKLTIDYEKIKDDVQAANKDSRFYQALAWTVVTRYDGLQTDYGHLLASTDRLKTNYSSFYDNLREVANIVQATQDVAQVGLNDLHRASVLRPLRVKQDLMKIGQGLDLVRLNLTELLVDAGLVASKEIGKAIIVSTSPSHFVPGSVEDAVRKLKAMYEACQCADTGDDDPSDDDGSHDSSLASIFSIDSSETHTSYPMTTLKDIICRIESGDREMLLKDLTTTTDIVDKIQQLVDESKDIPSVQSGAQAPCASFNEN